MKQFVDTVFYIKKIYIIISPPKCYKFSLAAINCHGCKCIVHSKTLQTFFVPVAQHGLEYRVVIKSPNSMGSIGAFQQFLIIMKSMKFIFVY